MESLCIYGLVDNEYVRTAEVPILASPSNRQVTDNCHEDTEPTVNGLDITPACIIGFAIRRMLDDEVRLPSSHAQSVITSPTEGFRTQLTLTAPQPVKSETPACQLSGQRMRCPDPAKVYPWDALRPLAIDHPKNLVDTRIPETATLCAACGCTDRSPVAYSGPDILAALYLNTDECA